MQNKIKGALSKGASTLIETLKWVRNIVLIMWILFTVLFALIPSFRSFIHIIHTPRNIISVNGENLDLTKTLSELGDEYFHTTDFSYSYLCPNEQVRVDLYTLDTEYVCTLTIANYKKEITDYRDLIIKGISINKPYCAEKCADIEVLGVKYGSSRDTLIETLGNPRSNPFGSFEYRVSLLSNVTYGLDRDGYINNIYFYWL